MCIRDRYQRRVHGEIQIRKEQEFAFQSKRNKEKRIENRENKEMSDSVNLNMKLDDIIKADKSRNRNTSGGNRPQRQINRRRPARKFVKPVQFRQNNNSSNQVIQPLSKRTQPQLETPSPLFSPLRSLPQLNSSNYEQIYICSNKKNRDRNQNRRQNNNSSTRFIRRTNYKTRNDNNNNSNNRNFDLRRNIRVKKNNENSNTNISSSNNNNNSGSSGPVRLSKTRLKVSNLHFNIINSELYELFTQFGSLKKCAINWDNLGRSQGTAIVEYEKPESAERAIAEYNGATLDGKTLTVEYAPREDSGREVPGIQRPVIRKQRRNTQPNRRPVRNFRRDRRGGNNQMFQQMGPLDCWTLHDAITNMDVKMEKNINKYFESAEDSIEFGYLTRNCAEERTKKCNLFHQSIVIRIFSYIA
eukprot:TRINITY_DN347_c0_g1_i6.p1 TRINITY_DN347_c0_g1~~TRINITY_DN347_c0_g1_i6.p1  ORF type:complete len:415 (-),score=69.80 TRINITY_DN347_c0_g1_i6:159-1403(-)